MLQDKVWIVDQQCLLNHLDLQLNLKSECFFITFSSINMKREKFYSLNNRGKKLFNIMQQLIHNGSNAIKLIAWTSTQLFINLEELLDYKRNIKSEAYWISFIYSTKIQITITSVKWILLYYFLNRKTNVFSFFDLITYRLKNKHLSAVFTH